MPIIYKMEGDPAPPQNTTVLQGLGLFKIWTTLVITPIIVVVLVVAMIWVSRHQKGWKVSTATAKAAVQDCPLVWTNKTTSNFTCTAKVSVADLPELGIVDLKIPTDKNAVDSGQTWPVAYDPAKPADTLTTEVMTDGGRTIAEVMLGVFLVVAVGFFFINFFFRTNKTWQNVSGIMEGSDIASTLLRR